jgi:hypothetical protein
MIETSRCFRELDERDERTAAEGFSRRHERLGTTFGSDLLYNKFDVLPPVNFEYHNKSEFVKTQVPENPTLLQPLFTSEHLFVLGEETHCLQTKGQLMNPSTGENQTLTLLIDLGATKAFINQTVVRKQQWLTNPPP